MERHTESTSPECARLLSYIALLERAVEYARNQQEREFMMMMPELDFTRLVVLDETPGPSDHSGNGFDAP